MVQGKDCCMGYEAKIEMVVNESYYTSLDAANSFNFYKFQTNNKLISIHISPAS